MPAPAVIPAPIAYIKIVAVKKLVVGFLVWCARSAALRGFRCVPLCACHLRGRAPAGPSLGRRGELYPLCVFYFEKIRVFKAGLRYEYISME